VARIAFRVTCNDVPVDRLAGRVAVVTGAGGGIGSEVALVFAEHGAVVVANDVDPHSLGQTALACQRHTSDSIAIVADVSDSAAVDDMFAQVRQRFGRVDALVTVAGISYLVPWFILFSQMNLVGTYTSLVLTHLTVGLPLTIWIMIGFVEDIPLELKEAALIDGCTRASVFFRICLPLLKPGIATAAILSFIMSWNNFLYSVILATEETRTLPVAVFNFLSFGAFEWGALSTTG